MSKQSGLARKAARDAKGARWCLGDAYVPHLKVQDVRSSGRKTRRKYQGREVHLLSDLELRAFVHFQWEPKVFGIEEQYYLEIEDTTRIAAEAGARHPRKVGTKNAAEELFEMTTDLVVYYRTERGEERRIARQIKYLKDLELRADQSARKRNEVMHTLEKLEIERRYLAERNVHWAVLTEADLTEVRTRNIEHLIDFELDANRPDGFWRDALDRVCEAVAGGEGLRMVDLQRGLEADSVLDPADFTACIDYLCAKRHLTFDMERPLRMLRPVSDFQFSSPSLRVVR